MIKFFYIFKMALNNLLVYKLRAFLTILGVVIGVSAIILVVSLGEGAQKLILNQLQSIGSKIIVVVPGREIRSLTNFAQSLTDSLKEKDLKLISKKENVPDLKRIMPVVFGAVNGAYENDYYSFSVYGATPLIKEIYDLEILEGGFFEEEDVDFKNPVIVLGYKVKEELFGKKKAVGEFIRIKNKNFKVVGVLKESGNSSFLNWDESSFMPYTSAQQYLFGIKHFNRLILEAETEESVLKVVEDVKKVLRESHNITDPLKDDFYIQTQNQAMERVKNITNILTVFLSSVAAISLIVGGIGIMNIMLVSVTERTKEIGLKKAIGATNSDILIQFLVEAIFLTLLGGIIGILLGAFLGYFSHILISKFLQVDWVFVFPYFQAILGLIISVILGLIFGLYPAFKASLKNPIDALRYE